jgi:hypothetical protein
MQPTKFSYISVFAAAQRKFIFHLNFPGGTVRCVCSVSNSGELVANATLNSPKLCAAKQRLPITISTTLVIPKILFLIEKISP